MPATAYGRGRRGLCQLVCLTVAGLLLGASLRATSSTATYPSPNRIVVVGDVHGDHRQLVAVLRMAGVIDDQNHWMAGPTHLVQLGDIPDRGPDTLKAIRLMQALEKEAESAGGRVHALIGNHEAMNVYGDLRYVVPGEFAAFVTPDSTALRDKFYSEHVARTKARPPAKQKTAFDEAYRQDWDRRFPLGYVEHRQAWQPGGEIWQWVIGHHAMVKIGDTVFVHGGIGAAFADQSLDQMNASVRTALSDLAKVPGSILEQEQGPLWYRGLAQHPEAEESTHVANLLKKYGARRIVLGHTPTAGAIMSRFNGAVILADVGLTRYYGSGLACMVIEGGAIEVLHRGSRLKLPTGEREDQVAYLELVAALEPSPATIRKLIDRLRAAPTPATAPVPAGVAK
jgi:Calcineurin-like phosphoesterase